MFRTRYIKSLIIAAAAVAAACTDDFVEPAGTEPVDGAEPASLTLNFSIDDLGIGVSTRGGASTGTDMGTRAATGTKGTLCDPFDKAYMLNPDNPWPELYPVEDDKGNEIKLNAGQYKHNHDVMEAALVDGSMITCLTVILINYHDNKIVAVRRIPDPNCPNHDVKYQQGTQSYPPAPGPEREKAKKNCILVKKEDGTFDLAPVLRDENGNVVEDDQGHIMGLVGTHACVTLDYENPIHYVKDGVYKDQSAEKLVRGEYTLLVIANYDHRVTTASAEGILDGSDTEEFQTLNVDKTLENLADKFHQPEFMANGIPDFRPAYEYLYNVRFLMNRTLEGIETQVDGQPSTVSYNVVDLPVNGKDGKPLKPYIRPAVHQTLTAAKDIFLEAGNNVIDIKLQRIASRTRVEVKNYADSPLKVHSLEFSPNYTQSTTYLFRRNKVDRDYKELATNKDQVSPTPTTGLYGDHDGKGAPMVDYTGIYNLIDGKASYGAIVPFIKDWDTDKDNVNDGVKVEAHNKRCIFDALMYESHLDYKDESHTPADPDSFTYTIEVSYPDITNYETPDFSKIDQEKWNKSDEDKRTKYDFDKATFEYANETNTKYYIQNPTSVDALYTSISNIEQTLDKSKGESLFFLIWGVGSNRYLYEKEDGTIYAHDAYENVNLNTQGIDINSFLWKLEGLKKDDAGNCTCYLTNLRSGKHMSTIPKGVAPTETSHMMSTDDTTIPKYKLGVSNLKSSEYNVTFSNTHDNTPYYLSVWANGTYLSGWNENDPGCQYQLFPVKATPTKLYVGTPRMKKEVTLTAFSDETAIVEKVREIRRNDFVRILVEVSYNPEEGDFRFRVEPWDKRSGAVDFH